MIRCPSCKMLNRVGSIHCGFCGHLLTDKNGKSDDPAFKAPKLSPSDSNEQDEAVPAAQPEAASRKTMFGMPAEEIRDPQAASAKTMVGMPAVKLDDAGAPLPPGVAEARAAAAAVRRPRYSGETQAVSRPVPTSSAQVVVSGAATDALADPPPPELEPRLRRRPPSKTLFGMRAAELHLGLAESEATEEPAPGPRLKEAFPILADTAEHRAVSEASPDEDPAPPAFIRRPSGSRIESLAPLKGEGAAFADTAVIRAVDPDDTELLAAVKRAQAEAAALVETAGSSMAPAPPLGEQVAPPRVPWLPEPAASVLPPAEGVPWSPGAGQVFEPEIAETPARAPVRPPPIPESAITARSAAAVTLPATAAVTAHAGLRGRTLLLTGGLALLASTFVPWSNALWRRVDLWADLGPVLLGVVALVLATSRRVPVALMVLIGVLALLVGTFQFIEVGWPGGAAGGGSLLHFGLVVGGAVLLGASGLSALRGPPRSSG